MAQQRDDSQVAGRYGLFVTAAGLVGVAGYVGYVLYPRFDLPAVEGAALLGLAAAAGLASFFSPCSFSLLLALLGRQAAARAGDHEAGPRPWNGCPGLVGFG